ncbi:CD1871A family CXXC motif-containing protein [Oscillospiraceae bacterium 44-34]
MNRKFIPLVRYSLLGLAAALTAVGLLRQEHLEVMGKAVRICLECIGIG